MTTREQRRQPKQNNFGEGPVWKCIVIQAIPLTLAQLVSLLYNVVDRIYLGHLGEADSMALTGVGLTFPIISLIMAFTALFGNGGVPLFAMARGRDDKEEASRIMGNSFGLLVLTSFALMSSLIRLVCGLLVLIIYTSKKNKNAEKYSPHTQTKIMPIEVILDPTVRTVR